MSAVQERSAASAGETVRFRLTFWQQVLSHVPMFIPLCGLAVIRLMSHPSASAAAYVPTAAERHEIDLFNTMAFTIVGVLFSLSVLQSRWFGVTLTPTEARVHNLRRRVIRWDDVRAVTTESLMGTRSVVLYEDGRRTRLRAPSTDFLAWDRSFEEKYHVIGQWWLAHRSQPDHQSGGWFTP
jgi:hypothetical protein